MNEQRPGKSLPETDRQIGDVVFNGESHALRLKTVTMPSASYKTQDRKEIIPLSSDGISVAVRGELSILKFAENLEGMQDVQVGNASGLYYPAAETIILWGIEFMPRFQTGERFSDPNLRVAWSGFETQMAELFPNAQQFATARLCPSNDPYAYSTFLTQLGYTHRQGFDKAFIKQILR